MSAASGGHTACYCYYTTTVAVVVAAAAADAVVIMQEQYDAGRPHAPTGASNLCVVRVLAREGTIFFIVSEFSQ